MGCCASRSPSLFIDDTQTNKEKMLSDIKRDNKENNISKKNKQNKYQKPSEVSTLPNSVNSYSSIALSSPCATKSLRAKSFSCEFYSFDISNEFSAEDSNSEDVQKTIRSIKAVDDNHTILPTSVPRFTRQATYFGQRKTISSKVNLGDIPGDLWWSDARNDTGILVKDMGPAPRTLSHVIKVRFFNKKSSNNIEGFDFFEDYVSMGMADQNKRYFILKFDIGDHYLVSLSEVVDCKVFEEMMEAVSYEETLTKYMKLIVSPSNISLPMPLLGPKAAESLGSYFGLKNVKLSSGFIDLNSNDQNTDQPLTMKNEKNKKANYICVYIDLYSKWILRRILPTMTLSLGRICDFFLVDYNRGFLWASFRLVCTESAIKLLKDKK